jgi:hypothetical protein
MSKRSKKGAKAAAKAKSIPELEAEYLHTRQNLIGTLTEGNMWITGPDDLPDDPDELHDALDEIEQHGHNHVSDARECREALDALVDAKGEIEKWMPPAPLTDAEFEKAYRFVKGIPSTAKSEVKEVAQGMGSRGDCPKGQSRGYVSNPEHSKPPA